MGTIDFSSSYGSFLRYVVKEDPKKMYKQCREIIHKSNFRQKKKVNLIEILDFIGVDDFFWNISRLSKYTNKQLVIYLDDKKAAKKRQNESYSERIERLKQEIDNSRMNDTRKKLTKNILTVRATHGEKHNFHSIENEMWYLRNKSTDGLKRALLYETIQAL
jgi:hypothetical protein